MKCPKCGYLGFETVSRCRNCGYDFSLSAERADAELTLRDAGDAPPALSDLALADDRGQGGGKATLDLDRLIGLPEDEPSASPAPAPPRITPRSLGLVDDGPTPLLDAVERAVALTPDPEPPADLRGEEDESIALEEAVDDLPPPVAPVPPPVSVSNLPLFGGPAEEELPEPPAEPAFVAPPRPAGPPLAVRRGSPDAARPRPRGPRPARRDQPLAFPDGGTEPAADAALEPGTDLVDTAPRLRRLAAAAIDGVLLAGICAGVLYLTLRLLDLTFDDVRELPAVPMAAFLVLLVVGYLIAFTAAGGQTIGKMAAGIRVVGDDGQPVDVAGASLRVAGNALQIATLGLAWLPALVAPDGRSVADRLARTRVVRA